MQNAADFHKVWKLVSESLNHFSTKLDLALESGMQSIMSNIFGDNVCFFLSRSYFGLIFLKQVMSLNHKVRCKIRSYLDDILAPNPNISNIIATNLNEANKKKGKKEKPQRTKEHRPSKTIEVAIQRCVRRATRKFLRDFIQFYLWDLDEPLLLLIQKKLVGMSSQVIFSFPSCTFSFAYPQFNAPL
jgi:hypothetical protein